MIVWAAIDAYWERVKVIYITKMGSEHDRLGYDMRVLKDYESVERCVPSKWVYNILTRIFRTLI